MLTSTERLTYDGLKIHMGRKYSQIDQIGNIGIACHDESDPKYDNTMHYWEKGRIGIVYQGGITFEISRDPNFPVNNWKQWGKNNRNNGGKLHHKPDNY